MAPTPPEREPQPRGLGVAVVFDWALTVQLLTQAAAAATGRLGLQPNPAAITARVAAAVLLLGLGEGLRRGVPALRLVQVAIMVLVTALGVVSAVVLISGHGDRSLVASTVIELTYPPWLAWRLASAPTARWFAHAHGRGGGRRTSGPGWVTVLAGWSVVWGVAVAVSQSL